MNKQAKNIHYYTNSFTQRFTIGLRGGWPGCPPRLFEAGQPGQQPPRLMLNRGGHYKETALVNRLLTEAVALDQTPRLIKQPPRLIRINRDGFFTVAVSDKD